jgi:outer membrane lipoprotein carrier protein
VAVRIGSLRGRWRDGVLCGALLALAAAAVAAESSPLLTSFLNDVKTLSADFHQTLIDADGEVLEESTGTLMVSRPGRFRWVYDTPYEQWLVADGLNVWSYDVDLEQVTVKAQAEALASTPALLLGGSDAVLNEFRYDGTADKGGVTWVRLVPLDKDSGFRQVELGFSDEGLTRLVFLDNLEQTTVVALDKVVTNEPIDAATFNFKIPDGVDVVGTPAGPQTGDP